MQETGIAVLVALKTLLRETIVKIVTKQKVQGLGAYQLVDQPQKNLGIGIVHGVIMLILVRAISVINVTQLKLKKNTNHKLHIFYHFFLFPLSLILSQTKKKTNKQGDSQTSLNERGDNRSHR